MSDESFPSNQERGGGALPHSTRWNVYEEGRVWDTAEDRHDLVLCSGAGMTEADMLHA